MKWLYSKGLLLVICLAAGLSVPAAGLTEVVTGIVLQVHRERNRLLLEPTPESNNKNSSLTVIITFPATEKRQKNHTRLPACILPGKVVQVQGSYMDQGHSLFLATTIRRMQRKFKDATGVRARLGSCRQEHITIQENISTPNELH